ncbi:MAG TPA: type II secretion system F family protein [Proteobacteria bacterium]|nr:type II secretion system protein F [bacterium BMS3Abin14]HDL53400.1 type II secretion system F family protein [Pseudomonadota bacterium]
MTVFKWEARTRQGDVKKGEMKAQTADAVNTALRRQGLNPSKVKAKPKEIKINIPGFGEKIKDRDVVIFTRQFATMIDAGLPLVQCLEILSEQSSNKTMGKALETIKGDVEGGASFAEALSKHPKIFDDLYVNMVEAGETGGILDTILSRLAAYMEKAIGLKKKIKSAMVYPLVTASVAVVVVAVLMIFVIPKFADMFTGMGGELPYLTKIVIGMSHFAASWNMLILVALVIVGGIILQRYYKTEEGMHRVDGLMLRAPIFGPLTRKAAVAKFTRTLGTMLSSGVPLLDALDICARTSGNKVVERAVFRTRESISEGKTIAEPLEETNVFPPMVVQMISVGEATGALDSMLGKIADFYDDEVDTAVGTLTSLLEPLMMVFLGGVVGFVVIAMYLPIFKMAALG